MDCRALAVKSYFLDGFQSKIITTHGIYYSKMSAIELLDTACIRSGFTKKGSKEAVRKLLNYLRKTPFLISQDVGAFPTCSSDSLECVWIFNHRFDVKELGQGLSLVTFKNGMSITVKASKHTLENQQRKLHTTLDIYRNIEREKELYISSKP
ncbi:competence protein ComK [Sporosarcina sp. G11-34]|uniref:competence protein ComK n=1 Tax=Sporosarcina sp. G11-34 TaxID=2849605 RepID=UPI0022A9BDFC|nr:competence protein ComK [Sporosarcina sp. G11-34]